MFPKQTKDYLDEILKNEKKEVKKRIYDKYHRWKKEKSTSSFDDFWLEVNRRIARGRLKAFNGASFEEHIHDLIVDRLPLLKERCFWGLDREKSNRKKVKLQLYNKTLTHKFDLAIHEYNKPVCLFECKTYLNHFKLLGLAMFCSLPAFKRMHIFYITHLLTKWDLEHKLLDFTKEATRKIHNFHYFKIGNLLWTGEIGNELKLDKKRKLDQTQNFLEKCMHFCRYK